MERPATAEEIAAGGAAGPVLISSTIPVRVAEQSTERAL